jgi:hypothetical protein
MKAWANEMVAVKAEIKKMKNKSDDQFSTLEPTRNYFLQGISAQNDYLDGEPDEKRELLQDLLWNFSLNNRIVQDLQYKPVYALIAKEPKPTDFETMLGREDSDFRLDGTSII